ncbi:MAG: M64 family metallopeptidase [Bacteroidales bacterium]|nr:M64 family metallopeptidase [Bacteroidales bacterium]MDD3009899.1 M64 family metallopeptidase [Bacteroidales bacterium]MDD3960403.1 M64 family metallopeptidase [Bacteroidales bacterium]MDY0285473.1 M64 family metallopeptidase [Bacteroidales bacterium]
MKKLFLSLILAISMTAYAGFNEFFLPNTLRLDYIHAGTATTHEYFFEGFRIEPHWGGTTTNCIDTLRYGNYFFEVYDIASGAMIYSRGYSSLFGEWQTTVESKTLSRSFYESVVMPLPRRASNIILYARDKKGIFNPKYQVTYQPDDYFVSTEQRMPCPAFDVHIGNRHTEKAVDIVILPEGYTKKEMGKFITDCDHFAHALFNFEPYKSRTNDFNIRGILAPSPEAGADIPADNIYVRTLMDASFYTFDSERYCMTHNHYAVRDLASNAPYDQIYILVNSTKYGGGAIYNFYSVSVTGSLASDKIIIHEFGHAFAGLADEYYDSSTSYNDFYPLETEPWQPNITTLVDFDKKWKHLMDPTTPIPTPATKAYENTLGVFEGGGYSAKGIYRPVQDCLMNTFKGDVFCPTCTEAIHKMIDFYTQ